MEVTRGLGFHSLVVSMGLSSSFLRLSQEGSSRLEVTSPALCLASSQPMGSLDLLGPHLNLCQQPLLYQGGGGDSTSAGDSKRPGPQVDQFWFWLVQLAKVSGGDFGHHALLGLSIYL